MVFIKNDCFHKIYFQFFLIFFSGDAMNLFLNDNWKSVANEIKPVLEDKIADLFKKFSNKIYHKYPLNTLLPP